MEGRGQKGRRAPQTYGVKVETIGPKELGPAEARVSRAEHVAEMLRKADAAYRKTPEYRRGLAAFLKEELERTPEVDMDMLGGRRTRGRGRGKKVTRRKRRHH
jgi:NAD(P)H-dependent FMN reductase